MIALLSFLHLLTSVCFAGTITDSTGKTVTVNDPQRIITLAGNVTETVFALGVGDKVVAVDASSLYPDEVNTKAKLGYHRNVSAEGILSLAPDLVIATDAAGPPPVIEQIRAAGIPIVILSSTHTLEGAQKRIEQIAKLLDQEKAGHMLVWDMQDQIKMMNKPPSAPTVLFIYARGAGTQNVAGADTGASAMIEMAGGTNAVTEYTGYKPMNAEAIIAAAPDYILLTARGLESLGGKESVAQLPGISETPAGKNGNIIAIDDLMLLGFGPRTAEAAILLSKALQ